MSFPRYPSYKDSGVEWLGEVPADWGGAVPGWRASGPAFVWRAKGPASCQPGATPQVHRRNGMRAESPAQPSAVGSPFQGLRHFCTATQGVALGWHGSRLWRCGGSQP